VAVSFILNANFKLDDLILLLLLLVDCIGVADVEDIENVIVDQDVRVLAQKIVHVIPHFPVDNDTPH
jgi:hypothetical protein